MDYTREPIIETVITPKEGCKLVLRNTKGASQEEYFVDAVEVVTFGTTHFFRSLEKPKPFLIPTTDFEVLEVREPRMILKTSGIDRSIKISGGKEKPQKEHHPKETHQKESYKEPSEEKRHEDKKPEEKKQEEKRQDDKEGSGERKRNRRSSRRRRDRDDDQEPKGESLVEGGELPPPPKLIAPPPTLISETLSRYRDQEQFKGAFYEKEAERREEPIIEEERPFFSETGEFNEADDLLFRTPAPEPASEGRVRRHRHRKEEVPQVKEVSHIEEDPFDNPPLIGDDM